MNFYRNQLTIIYAVTLFAACYSTEKYFIDEDLAEEDESPSTYIDYRLPTTIYPTSYDIMLVPQLQGDFSFRGIAKIKASVAYETSSVTLHCGNITVTSSLVRANNTKLRISKISYDKITEKYEISLDESLKEGTELLLVFTYDGTLSDNSIGFYRSSYYDTDGTLKWLAATQFQTTHARHAFPCFDEPQFKATFTISIQRQQNFKCLSNMPLQETTAVGDGVYWDKFKPSIPMSTYLVAFVISEFKSLKEGNFSVWAKPEAIEQARYALEIGPRTLDYLANTFDQKYQLPKMDMVAVPDFAAGAMENWGLITYRETRMLYNEKICSDSAQQSVASVIVHECTHMWFGNLVTPVWWSYLWLSEAFARYFQYFATAKIETSWNMENQFVVEQHQVAYAVDALESSKPMTRNANSQSEIGGMGDQITYSKGGSIVRMMNLMFGSEIFDQGLRNYLKHNKKRGTGSPEYLWKAIQEEFDRAEFEISVRTIMKTWTIQPGFPVVSVSVDVFGNTTLKQERFLLRNLNSTPTNKTWWVPITWATRSNPDFNTTRPKHWLKDKSDTIYVDKSSDDWIIFNVQLAGFYRVNYDNSSWYRIIDVLNSNNYKTVHVLNRAAILDDLLNLARAGLLDYKTAFDGLRYLRRETSYLPFKAAFNALEYLNRRFTGWGYHSVYSKYILALIDNIYNQIGYDDKKDDNRLTILLRRDLNSLACKFGHNECISRAMQDFRTWKTNPPFSVSKNQRTVAYSTAIMYGTLEDWDFLWQKYLNATSASEQTVILNALGYSNNIYVLDRYLMRAISGYERYRIRKQDSTSVFSAVYSASQLGAEYVLEFVGEHHKQISNYYGGLDTVASIIAGASQHFSTPRLVEKFEKFINTFSVELAPIRKSLDNSLKLAKYELRWLDRNMDHIVQNLKEFIENTATSISTTTGSISPITNATGTNEWNKPTTTTMEVTLSTIDYKPTISTASTSATQSTSSAEKTTPTVSLTSTTVPITSTSTPSITTENLISSTQTSKVTSSTSKQTTFTTTTVPTQTKPVIETTRTTLTTASGSTQTKPVIETTRTTLTTTWRPTQTKPVTETTYTTTSMLTTSITETTATTRLPTILTLKPTSKLPTSGTGSQSSLIPSSTEPILPPITESPNVGENTTYYRLPFTVVPRHYNITLQPYIKENNFTFDGSVRIVAFVAEDTNKIVLHSSELEHHTIRVFVDGEELNLEHMYEEKYNFLWIALEQTLVAGTDVVIDITYTGTLNKEMRGFYRSSYVNENKVTRWLAATHLEPVGARKMFPCFDEPAMKAVFSLTVSVTRGYQAISNMPIKVIYPASKGRLWYSFKDTPKMSTYLLALIVSDFSYSLSTEDEKTREYLVWARPNAVNHTKYALSVMEPLVKTYEELLGHKYQLPKLDMAALPDFASGAMENWGLLTYKETNMIYDPKIAPINNKQSVINTVSHEISHQWFGNLVSPLWWKYLWLNEGFARYFQYFGTSKVETTWDLESQFVVDQVHSAFASDGLTSSHPMTHDVFSPAEIRGIFDSISYAKSASVLRMIEKSFGSKVFYAALRNYLEARQYSVATPEDLYEALQAQVNNLGLEDKISTILDTWTTQAGYPVIHVNVGGRSIKLKQERFLLRNYKNVSTASTWYVPLTWASKSNPIFNDTTPRMWLKEAEKTFDISRSIDEWYIFNVQQAGYYRVNYDIHNWLLLIKLLKTNRDQIPEINRAALINDLFDLGRAEYVNYSTVLSATQYLIDETEYIPWRGFFNGIAYLDRRFQGQEIYESYKKYMTAILTPIYDRLTFFDKELDSHTTLLLRKYIREWACKFDISDCRETALEILTISKWDIQKMPPNYRRVTYCVGFEHLADALRWNTVWLVFKRSTVTAEKLDILKSLSCSRNTTLLNKLLSRAITENSGIRYQESAGVFSAVYDSSLIGVDCVIDFITMHYQQMYKYYGDIAKVRSIIHGLGQRVTTPKLYNKYIKLLKLLKEIYPPISKSLRTYQLNAYNELMWYERNAPSILEWLETNYPSENYRLPTTVRPKRYNITISPSLDFIFTFNGHVKIDLTTTRPTSVLILNANDIRIENILVYSTNEKKLFPVSSHAQNKETQMLSIFLKKIIDVRNVTIEINYWGHINDDMNGFYRSSYKDKHGKTHWMATTQFQPTYARKAFPCFDEPEFKATFIINIRRPTNYITLSNMPLERTTPESRKYEWDSFYETKPMSTYLVAFIVTEFQPIRNKFEEFNVYGRPEVVSYGDFAQSGGALMLKFLETYTGMNYSFPKMDLVGIPDFDSVAMENWGLITFREYSLFYDKEVTSAAYAKTIVTTVAHELVHMWFGNLVTCKWWEYIWLNEGFAEYLQWIVADSVYPDYELQNQFVVYELQASMDFDATNATHPMNYPVATSSDISGAFDKIAYGKAASVLRMIVESLDPYVFRYTMRDYLETYQYDTVTPSDLVNKMQAQINRLGYREKINIEKILSSWTNQSGFPVVEAIRSYDSVILTQRPFSLTGEYLPRQTYWVPITIATQFSPNFRSQPTDKWLNSDPMTIFIDPRNDWFLINVRQVGYYRVNYDIHSWYQLIKLLSRDHTVIPETNRAQIIDDVFNLARAGLVPYKVAFQASKYLTVETKHLPWKAFFNVINYLVQRFEGYHIYDLLKTHVESIAYNSFVRLRFNERETDHHLDQLNRELILLWMCKFNNALCVRNALNLYTAWINDASNRPSPNIRPAVYCTAIQHGTHDDWLFMKNQYLQANLQSEKYTILNALGCTENSTTLYSYLVEAFASNKSTFRPQDVTTIFSAVISNNQIGVDIGLEFLMTNYYEIKLYFNDWDDLTEMFSDVAARINKQKQIDKLDVFIRNNRNQLEEILSSLQSNLDTAKTNMKWFKTYSPTIEIWLKEFGRGPNSATTYSSSIMITILTSLCLYLLS